MLLFSHLCGPQFISQLAHALNPDCIYFHFFNSAGPLREEPLGPSLWEGMSGISEPELCVILQSIHLLLTLLLVPAEVANFCVSLNEKMK